MIVHSQVFEVRHRTSVADYAIEPSRFEFYRSDDIDMEKVASRCLSIVEGVVEFDDTRHQVIC